MPVVWTEGRAGGLAYAHVITKKCQKEFFQKLSVEANMKKKKKRATW